MPCYVHYKINGTTYPDCAVDQGSEVCCYHADGLNSREECEFWNKYTQKRERGTVLNEAIAMINGERQSQYGDPEDSFGVIANYWSNYLEKTITGKDVALMMTLFKIARESNQGKRDNLVDAAGYIGIAGDMEPAPEKMGDTAAYEKGFEDREKAGQSDK